MTTEPLPPTLPPVPVSEALGKHSPGAGWVAVTLFTLLAVYFGGCFLAVLGVIDIITNPQPLAAR